MGIRLYFNEREKESRWRCPFDFNCLSIHKIDEYHGTERAYGGCCQPFFALHKAKTTSKMPLNRFSRGSTKYFRYKPISSIFRNKFINLPDVSPKPQVLRRTGVTQHNNRSRLKIGIIP
jgi:hypothetical protein